MTKTEKWLTLVLICLSGSFIWWLPYFQDIYYVPMQRTFGFSNTQIGTLSGVAGLAAMVTYVPGGWLADRFPPRQLMSTALVISAMGGFVFARIPPYEVCLWLYGMWGVSAALIFWAAMIKATRNWGGADDQGKAFGFLEGGRSFSDASFATLLLAIFAWRGADSAALSDNINLLSSSLLVMALLVWLIMKNPADRAQNDQAPQPAFSWARLRLVLRMPILWLLSLIVLATNWGMWGTVYFTPYATVVYELGDVWGAAVGTGKYYVAAIAAVCAGFIADRIGIAKAVVGLFTFMTAGFILFAVKPGATGLVPLFLINAVIITLTVYALRGIYYALMEQGGVPVAVTGTAVGMVSVIGYTPDFMAPVVAGLILDAWPGARGFQILFALMAGLSILGLIASVLVFRRYGAKQAAKPLIGR